MDTKIDLRVLLFVLLFFRVKMKIDAKKFNVSYLFLNIPSHTIN